MALNPYQVATQSMRRKSGLPRVILSEAKRREVSLRHSNLGATTGRGDVATVAGQPSMILRATTSGGVATEIARNSKYIENITDAELAGVRRIARDMVSDARRSSQETLSRRDLRKRNHPYGYGSSAPSGKTRRGVSNMSVLNKQSGRLARSWRQEVRRGKGGLLIRLRNTAPYAKYTALGTDKMRAHGPYTTVPVNHLPALNKEFLRISKLGYRRERMIEAVGRLSLGNT
jgi:hypothetical protein